MANNVITKQFEGVLKGEMYIFLADNNVGKSKFFSNPCKEIEMPQSTKFSYTMAALGQPFETMRGIKAKLISYEASLEKPLIVQVGDQVYNYTIQGKRSRSGRDVPLDLRMTVKATPTKAQYFVNISHYPELEDASSKTGIYLHSTHEYAIRAASKAECVRVVAMPITAEIKDDQLQVYTPEGHRVNLKINPANAKEEIAKHMSHIARCEGYKL